MVKELLFQGHVNWDTAVPANIGYIASILWNQNNCAAEGGPMTTAYEIEAGSDLCEMIGLDRDQSMGHLVAGGSIANIEAIWVARNLKYYPLGLQEALLKDEKLRGAREYEVRYFVPVIWKRKTRINSGRQICIFFYVVKVLNHMTKPCFFYSYYN